MSPYKQLTGKGSLMQIIFKEYLESMQSVVLLSFLKTRIKLYRTNHDIHTKKKDGMALEFILFNVFLNTSYLFLQQNFNILISCF
jgi:hypothetical protein